MARWEYQAWDIAYLADDGDDAPHVVAIDSVQASAFQRLPLALNAAGWLGWELVSVVREPTEEFMLTLFLKRQILD